MLPFRFWLHPPTESSPRASGLLCGGIQPWHAAVTLELPSAPPPGFSGLHSLVRAQPTRLQFPWFTALSWRSTSFSSFLRKCTREVSTWRPSIIDLYTQLVMWLEIIPFTTLHALFHYIPVPSVAFGKAKAFLIPDHDLFPHPAPASRMLSMSHNSTISQAIICLNVGQFLPKFGWVRDGSFSPGDTPPLLAGNFLELVYPLFSPSFSLLSFPGTLLFGGWNRWIGPLMCLFLFLSKPLAFLLCFSKDFVSFIFSFSYWVLIYTNYIFNFQRALYCFPACSFFPNILFSFTMCSLISLRMLMIVVVLGVVVSTLSSTLNSPFPPDSLFCFSVLISSSHVWCFPQVSVSGETCWDLD